jgi:hypothetical protein
MSAGLASATLARWTGAGVSTPAGALIYLARSIPVGVEISPAPGARVGALIIEVTRTPWIEE